MPGFGDILKTLREGKRLTQKELAAFAGLSEPTIRRAERSAVPLIRGSNYRRIAEALGMTAEELDKQWRATSIPQTRGGAEGFIALINKTPAGPASDFEECGIDSRQGYDSIERSPYQIGMDLLFAVVVVGDSMTPEFREGDTLVFRPIESTEHLDDGTPVFVRFTADREHGCTFKRVFDRGDVLELRADNPQYGPLLVRKDHIERMSELIEVRRRYGAG